MVKYEWGSKRVCQSCGEKFYDLRKSPIVCPKCGAVHELFGPAKAKRSKAEKTKVIDEDKLIDHNNSSNDELDIVEDDPDLDNIDGIAVNDDSIDDN